MVCLNECITKSRGSFRALRFWHRGIQRFGSGGRR
jgi:hypothetical protein